MKDPRAEAHRARQRAMRESMRPSPPDTNMAFVSPGEFCSEDEREAAKRMLRPNSDLDRLADTDATELSGADTDRPDVDFGSGTADPPPDWVTLGTHRINVIARDLAGGIPERVELDSWLRECIHQAITSELPDGTWDVRITAVRRGE